MWRSILEAAGVAIRDRDGVWLVYTHTRDDLLTCLARGVPLGMDFDVDEALTWIAIPLCNLLTSRMWPDAALSRWTGVVTTLKKCALGMSLNGVMLDALCSMAATMQLDQAEVARGLAEAARLEAAGADNRGGWWKHCSRVLKVSKFFSDTNRPWQLAIVLTVVVVIDILHHAVIGKNCRPATLSDMVDPQRSIVVGPKRICWISSSRSSRTHGLC